MSYNITKTDGSELIELQKEIKDTQTISGISLIGYLIANYGKEQSENFVHLTENFADVKFPEKSLVGQLCYKKSSSSSGDGSLYVCISESGDDLEKWKKLPLVYIGTSSEISLNSDYITGDMWYDTENKCFKMYDEEMNNTGDWIIIGPSDYNHTIEGIAENLELIDFSKLGAKYGFNNAYLITLYIIGRKPNDQEYTNSSDCCGWKVQLLVNDYQNASSDNSNVSIIGNPNYELIGTTNNNMTIQVKIENGKLVLNTVDDNNIKWVTKYNLLKVW